MTAGNRTKRFDFEQIRGLVAQQRKHDADPQTFAVYTDLINDELGRRHKRPGIGLPVNNTAAGADIYAIHEYMKRDPTTGVLSYYIFRTVANAIQRWDTGTSAWVSTAIPFVPTGSRWVFVNFRNRCYATSGFDALIYFDGVAGPDARDWYLVGAEEPVIAAGYSLTAVDPIYQTGTVGVVKGSNTLVGTGTAWTTGGAWSGKFIDIAGVRYQISVVGTGTSLTLTEPYRGVDATGLTYKIYPGLMDWDEPPRYTYAYVNTRTGHVGNAAPATQITEKDRVGTTVRLTGIPRSPTAFNNGYDKIQIYRAAKNGTALVAINDASGLINNSAVVGTVTFTETVNTYRDINLGFFSANIISNRGPVTSTGAARVFLTIAAAGERLFVYSVLEGIVYYSGDRSEIVYGRADECFPDNFQLTCADARGMLTVGTGTEDDALVIQRGQGDSVVVGSNVLSFRLRGAPTRRAASGQYLATVVAGRLVEFYNDRRLIDYGIDIPGGDIGAEIQPLLDAVKDSLFTSARLHWHCFGGYNLLLLSAASGSGSTANDVTFVYDYDARCWYRWSVGFAAFATVSNPTTGAFELWAARASNRKVYKLLTTAVQDDGSNFTPALSTALLRPFGESQRAQFAWCRLFVNDPAATWLMTVKANEDPTGTALSVKVDNFRFQTAAGKKLVAAANTNQQVHGVVHQVDITFPTGNADYWIDAMSLEYVFDQTAESIR